MIIQGDCLEKLKELEDNSVDSVVCDPPYELGFMGKSWDNTGIANNKEMWAECLRVLKPGGHLLSFSGTRTYHRMACAIEDAGFEVRDMIEWVYGSGFPKSLNIGKAVDKLQGNEREDLGEHPTINGTGKKWRKNGSEIEYVEDSPHLTKGTSEWEGWGTALKPAHEPICMARKPLSEKLVAENVLKWGTGGINIDESRVEFEKTQDVAHNPLYRYQNKDKYRQVTDNGQHEGLNVKFTNSLNPPSELGRFPANLIHDNSEEVRECFPETKSGAMNGTYKNTMMKGQPGIRDGKEIHLQQEASSGNASRFFKSIIYQAKSSKSERNKGLDSIVLLDIMGVWKENNTTKEEKLIRFVVSGLSPEKVIVESGIAKKNDKEWSMFLFGKNLMEKYQQDTGFTTKMETSSITVLQIWNYLMHLLTKGYIQDVKLETATGGNLAGSAENYSELIITISEKMASLLGVKNVQSLMQLKISVKEGSNFHSTVKPIALMEYLIKMVTPKGGTVLDPFMGSGSTGVACKKNGYDFIGIEKEEEYIKIAEARIKAVKVENKLLQ